VHNARATGHHGTPAPVEWTFALGNNSTRLRIMKKVTTILFAAAVTTAFAVPVFAGSAGVSRSYTSAQSDQTTIAQLQDASQAAQRQALDGNKNNLEFRRKSYEIDQLIERMKSGQQVDPAELDKAMEPAHVW
jgi:hypothetical protein